MENPFVRFAKIAERKWAPPEFLPQLGMHMLKFAPVLSTRYNATFCWFAPLDESFLSICAAATIAREPAPPPERFVHDVNRTFDFRAGCFETAIDGALVYSATIAKASRLEDAEIEEVVDLALDDFDAVLPTLILAK